MEKPIDELFYAEKIDGNEIQLLDQEAVHCALVLRKKIGDHIWVTDGIGNIYHTIIEKVNKREVKGEVIFQKSEPNSEKLILAVAPTKNRDRLEWMVEKITEIGILELILLECDNSERHQTKIERLEKKCVAAMKQSLRFHLPKIRECTFDEILILSDTEKFIAHCDSQLPRVSIQQLTPERYKNPLVLIGPEGDFSSQEISKAVEHNFQALSLGAYRLRTETAAIAASVLFADL